MMEILLQEDTPETVAVVGLGKPVVVVVVVEYRWVVAHEDRSVHGAVLLLAVVVEGCVALTARLEITLSVNLK